MVQFMVRRTLFMIPTLLAISVLSFVIIELPPGDYVTDYIAGLLMEGTPLRADSSLVSPLPQVGLGLRAPRLRVLPFLAGTGLGADPGAPHSDPRGVASTTCPPNSTSVKAPFAPLTDSACVCSAVRLSASWARAVAASR